MNHQNTAGERGNALLAELNTLDNVSLDHIDLNSCRLHSLPESLKHFTGARVLSVYDNDLTDLPEWFWEFQQLRVLNLSANRLSRLSEGLERLHLLEMLDLGHN
ncbi:hypothetical protein [Deinococcus sp.]|uniref:hypothetical protein n=1 Tax=Deinococcus sp. TaxID=47478 RepID=UPI003CC5841B